ncbi:MAG: hypothetical protein DHS20C18_52640 [Saprospiraceae bacterium]|nr:MAG: hypothetical protein DHS20C18_52640 [Saprospiraceae bacterium]
MRYMHNNYDSGIFNLVTEYENNTKLGLAIFLEEFAYKQLIDYYEKEEQLDKALDVVEQAISSHNYSVGFYLRKAELLIDMGQVEQALCTLDQANSIAPAELEITLLRAEAMTYSGKSEEALVLLLPLKSEVNQEALSEIYMVEALIHEYREDFELMFYCLRASLQENPRNEVALERLWLSVELSRNYEASIKLHEEIINEHPYSSLAWYNLGHAHAYLGNYEEAIDAYEFAFVIDEKFEFAYRDCADLCFETKQYDKSLKYYHELLEHFDADGDLLLRIGQCHQEKGDFDKARKYYRKANHLDPLNDEVYFHLGQCYAHEQKWKEALRYFHKAVQIEDRQEEYYEALAIVYYELKQYEKALPCFERANEIAPENSLFWMNHAAFLWETGRGEMALELLEEAEDYAVGGELIFARIACLFYLGRRQEAAYWLVEALEEAYDSHTVLFQLISGLQDDPLVTSIIADFK